MASNEILPPTGEPFEIVGTEEARWAVDSAALYLGDGHRAKRLRNVLSHRDHLAAKEREQGREIERLKGWAVEGFELLRSEAEGEDEEREGYAAHALDQIEGRGRRGFAKSAETRAAIVEAEAAHVDVCTWCLTPVAPGWQERQECAEDWCDEPVLPLCPADYADNTIDGLAVNLRHDLRKECCPARRASGDPHAIDCADCKAFAGLPCQNETVRINRRREQGLPDDEPTSTGSAS